MLKKALLVLLGVVVGLVVGGALNMGLVQLNMKLHGPPDGLDWKDPVALEAFVSGLPVLGFLIVLLAHAGQAFLGSLVGTLVAGRRTWIVAGIIGVLTLLGCIVNLVTIPSPVWFVIADLVLPLPAAWLGARLVMRRAA